jgi:hypothetical protein
LSHEGASARRSDCGLPCASRPSHVGNPGFRPSGNADGWSYAAGPQGCDCST